MSAQPMKPSPPGDETRALAYLPLALLATFAVVVLPMLVALWLRGTGVLSASWSTALVGVSGSFAASTLGAALWKRNARSCDVFFSDLMLWGWLHRWRGARRVDRSTALLARQGATSSSPGLSVADRTALLRRLIGDLEHRDPYTHGHSRRVARHAADIADQMGLGKAEVERIRAAGAIHDVGKVNTPPAILHKPGRLSPEEFAVIERHVTDGTDMVVDLADEVLTGMVRHHHERIDGRGYPDGLAGEEIPLGARILAVADTFDAITSTRPYRRAHTHDEALRILEENAGSQLDPEAVRAFKRSYAGRRPLALWAGFANAWPRASTALGAGAAGAAKVGVVNATIAASVVAGGVVASHEVRPADALTTARAEAVAAPAGGSPAGSGSKPTRSTAAKAAGGAAPKPAPSGATGGTSSTGKAAVPSLAQLRRATQARARQASAPAGGGATGTSGATTAAPAGAAPAASAPQAPAPATPGATGGQGATAAAAAASEKKRRAAAEKAKKAERKAAKQAEKARRKAAKQAEKAGKARKKAEKEKAKRSGGKAQAAETAEAKRTASERARKAAAAKANRDAKKKGKKAGRHP